MKILVHICCANCAIFPVRSLRESGHEVSGYFFNHNIHPYQEYRKRFKAVEEYSTSMDLEMIYKDEYLMEDFLSQVAIEPSARCTYCYQSRLKEAVTYAKRFGYDAFTTTLLYSRYQNHELITNLGEELAAHFDIPFFYNDFRKGWHEGIQTSKAMGLYRQQYCGCIYSEKDRYHPNRSN